MMGSLQKKVDVITNKTSRYQWPINVRKLKIKKKKIEWTWGSNSNSLKIK